MQTQTAPLHRSGRRRTHRREPVPVGLVLVTGAAAMLLLLWPNPHLTTGPDVSTLPAVSTDTLSNPESRHHRSPRRTAIGAAAGTDTLRNALDVGDYEGAVERYAQAFESADPGVGDTYRDTLLEHASDLIQVGDYDSATALLDAYLAVFFRDTEAWVYAGRAYREKRAYRPAIEAFLMAAQQDLHPDLRRLVTGQLSLTVNFLVQQLLEEQRQEEIAELYAYLTQADPRNPHYFVALARAYLALGRRSDAMAALYHVAAEEAVADQVRHLVENIGAVD